MKPQDLVKDVLSFHEKFGQYVGTQPHWPPFDVMRMRIRLVGEEYEELSKALAGEDIALVADGVGDLIYVLIGLMNAMGVDMRPIWAAIQRSNMAKEGGPERADGKILKPEGWTPPDIWMLLALQPDDWMKREYKPQDELEAPTPEE